MKAQRIGLVIVLLATIGLLIGIPPVKADGNGHIAVLGRDYTVQNDVTLNNDLAIIAGSLILEPGAQINGQVAITGGDALIQGRINGNLVVAAGTVRLAPTAVVNGDVISLGTITREAGAVVNGRVISGPNAAINLNLANSLAALGSRQWARPLNGLAGIFGILGLIGAFAVLALLFYVAWPARVTVISDTLNTSWVPSLGLGLLTLLLFLVLVPILVVICIGIPIAIVLAIGLLVADVAGWAALGLIVGRRLGALLHIQGSPIGFILAGIVVMALLGLVPCLGTILAILASAAAVGATLLTRLGARGYPPALPAAGDGSLPEA